MSIQIGRLGQPYLKVEAGGYAVAPTFAATDAFRHLELDLTTNKLARTNAPDRVTTPDLRRRITNRTVGSWAIKKALMWPSGTPGTLPELTVAYENGLGAKHGPTPLSTTVSASPSPTTTVFSVAAVTGLAVNDPIQVQTPTGLEIVFVQAIATLALTVAPALSAAPATGATVKSGVGYSLATDLAKSFDIGHYITTSGTLFSREALGCVLDKLGFAFDANAEPVFTASGPCQDVNRPAQAQPGAFTTTGSAIPSGILGALKVNGVAYPMMKAAFNITNGMKLRNAEMGTNKAIGFYRAGRRVIEVQIDVYVEDPAPIYANAETATALSVSLQCGTVNGQIWGVYCPKVEFEMPTTPDGENELMWSFKGTALGTAGNDELFLGQV